VGVLEKYSDKAILAGKKEEFEIVLDPATKEIWWKPV